MCKISFKLNINNNFAEKIVSHEIDKNKLDQNKLVETYHPGCYVRDHFNPNPYAKTWRSGYTEYGDITLKDVPQMPLSIFNKLANNTGAITRKTIYEFVEDKVMDKVQANIGSAIQGIKPVRDGNTITFEASSDKIFGLIGAKDKNKDNNIQLNELPSGLTAGQAIEIVGNDSEATPSEALQYYLKKSTAINAYALDIGWDVKKK